jgi:hypothetical protein
MDSREPGEASNSGVELGLTADTVEQVIFGSAIAQEGSALWGERWAGSEEPPARAAQAALLELERLFDTADPRVAREARDHLDELARIIRQDWSD